MLGAATLHQESVLPTRGMLRGGGAISAALHGVFLVGMVVGLPQLYREPITGETAIPVQIVTRIAEASHAPGGEPTPATETEMSEPEPEAEPEEVAEAEPEPEPEEVAEAEPDPEPTPEPEPVQTAAVEPPPPPPPPEPVSAPEPEVVPLPEDIVKKEPEPEPEHEAKPEPQQQQALASIAPRFTPPPPARKPKPKTRKLDFASVLKTVNKLKSEKKAKSAPKVRAAETKTVSIDDQQLAKSLGDLIKEQIWPCWNIPAGARDAKNLSVEIRILLNTDGSVREAEIVDVERMLTDPYFRAAAESAYRALLNPRCAPLKNLPPDRYAVWQSMRVNFNPSGMFRS